MVNLFSLANQVQEFIAVALFLTLLNFQQ